MGQQLQVHFYVSTFWLTNTMLDVMATKSIMLLHPAEQNTYKLLTNKLICFQVIFFCHFFSICKEVVYLPFSWELNLHRLIIKNAQNVQNKSENPSLVSSLKSYKLPDVSYKHQRILKKEPASIQKSTSTLTKKKLS